MKKHIEKLVDKLTSLQTKKKQKWKPGDLFGVPLPNDQYCLGQVLGPMTGYKNVLNCAFFDIRFELNNVPKLNIDKLIAVLSTTRDLLDEGYWVVVGNASSCIEKKNWPNEQFSKCDYVGAKTYGSGNVKHFIEAYYGFAVWNSYKDPQYFEKLLVSPSKRPPDEKLKLV